jgi:Tfp pilus assembly protein PilP
VSAFSARHVSAGLLVLALAACSSEPPPAPPKPTAGQPATPQMGKPSAAQTKGGKPDAVAGVADGIYAKVDDAKYRVTLTREMFTPDPTGEINRDPFRSYVIEETPVATAGNKSTRKDECEKGLVAETVGLRDLTLTGIVKRGTTAFALFEDKNGDGWVAKRGECLSKDKSKISEIGSASITVTIGTEEREEEWKLHPEELEGSDPTQMLK